ncbi:lipid A biosynthesis protein [Rhodobacteraceae bacterium CYK-10]|uniref:Lipid A biosynthesis protein n=2 Tax=Stagnihabitans tardus TaxID=2699202 RepID=A0AAE5BTQ4_9RHOB|nr:lipid A biosynthesis protein [Stagnihabitans tardus]
MMGVKTATDAVWVLVGIGGQLMFTARFLMQWWASEKAGRSVVPVSFWYFSIAGSLIVLAYGIREVEPVIILGQLPGTVIYTRNLWLIRKERERLGG